MKRLLAVCVVMFAAGLSVWGQHYSMSAAQEPGSTVGLVRGPTVDRSIPASAERTFAVVTSAGGVNAATPLVSGKPANFSFPYSSSRTVFNGDFSFQIVVPSGATRLEIRLTTTMPAADLDLFVRFDSDVGFVPPGSVAADYASAHDGSNEIIVVRPTSSPPLQAGTYYIAVALYSPGMAATGTILATVDTGPILPIGTLLTSGTPLAFSFSPVSGSTLFNGEFSYGIVAPPGAAKLEIQVTTSTPGVDVDLFVRADTIPKLSGGGVASDYASVGPTGNEAITITPSSTPPLRAGTYYVALGLVTPGMAVTGTIVAKLTVGAASPAINAPLTLDFGSVTLGQSKDLSLTISNTGGSTLTVSSVASSNAQFRSLMPSTPFTVPASGVQALSIRFQPAATGAQTGTLTIASNDPVRSTVNVTLTGSGQTAPSPAIAVSTASLSFTAQAGGPNPAAQTFTVRNSGSGTLNFQITATQAWLSVSPTGGSSTGSNVTITASVSTSGLTAGSYNGEIRVAPAGSALSTTGAGPEQATSVAIAVLLTVSAPTPVISQAGVVNAASFQPGMVPGSLATLFGTNLSPVTGVEMPGAATSYKGVSVKVQGRQVPLFAIANVSGQEQINFQAPFDLSAPATASVEVNNNGLVGSLNVQLLSAQPGIFEYTPPGTKTKYAIALRTDYSLIGPSNPAAHAEAVSLFLTGMGITLPILQTGEPGPSSPPAVTYIQPAVQVGGAPAEVLFSGYAPGFLGLYQINFSIPATAPSGAASLVVSAGGVTSQTSNIAVQ